MTCERRGYFTDVSLLLVLRGVGDTEKTQLVSNMSDVLIPSKAGSTFLVAGRRRDPAQPSATPPRVAQPCERHIA
jgi:hypothetical protein